MGKKGRHKKKSKFYSDQFEGIESKYENFDPIECLGAKASSKISKKQKKKLLKHQQKQSQSSNKRKKDKKISIWHQVRVSCSCNVERNFLLTSIGAYVDTPFCPLGYHKEDENIVFYLEGKQDVADSIASLDRRIQTPSKESMRIKVSSVDVPNLVLNAEQLVVLQEVIAQRFNAALSLLDLSNLHMDPQFLTMDYLVPLANPLIMKQIFRMTAEHFSSIKALNLAANNLGVENVKPLQKLVECGCQIAALNLEKNRLHSFHFLKYIKRFTLTELSLDGNEVLNTIKNPLHYINIVRKELPHLAKLDGIDVDKYVIENRLKPSKLDVISASKVNIPTTPTLAQVHVTEESMKLFLEQYYKVIDGTERVNLCQAYIPQATVQLNSTHSSISSFSIAGLSQIEEFMKSFTETRHIHSSFSLNVAQNTPTVGVVEIKGKCYLKCISETQPIEFARKMTLLPFNNGICCSNDILEIGPLVSP